MFYERVPRVIIKKVPVMFLNELLKKKIPSVYYEMFLQSEWSSRAFRVIIEKKRIPHESDIFILVDTAQK